MRYNFTDADIKNITDAFGGEFFSSLADKLDCYCALWELEIRELVDYFSVNCIFVCASARFGDCVLKVCSISASEMASEYHTLMEYGGGHCGGNRHCKVHAADLESGVILLEKITPGTRLRDEKSLEARLGAFASLYTGLHIAPSDAGKYIDYAKHVSDMLVDIANYEHRETIPEHGKLCEYMEKANRICAELCEVYDKKMLLHGDMHYDNIILGSGGEYVLIDPQGYVGDPVFDIARYLLNEVGDLDGSLTDDERFAAARAMTTKLQSLTGVPYDVMEKCLFIDTVMIMCWEVTVGETDIDCAPIELAERLIER